MNLRFIGGLGQSAKIPTGGRELWEVWGTGPTSYSQATGDPINGPAQGEHMSAPSGAILTLSGNYEVIFQPLGTNTLRPGWLARWRFSNIGGGSGVANVTENAAGTGMTPGTYPITFSGGTGSGAAGTVTVSATAVTAVSITNPGHYTVAPTAAIGGTPGGTPASLTVVMSTAGEEVTTGTNLSGESVQFLATGGQY